MAGTLVAAIAAVMMAQAAGPSGQAPATSTTQAAPPTKPAKPEKVCVEEQQIGSHFRRRICATPEEWERRRIKDHEAMSRTGGKAPSTCTGVAC